ncbi:ferredoxin reductase family protein [Steroidobacter sp.]|uniref:ferredoxin reductase family protein n=1 Tax=Steroidobacter sp. TaxID=1978227 RepID=UPI0039C94CD0
MKAWQAIAFLTAVSFGLVLAEIPRADWNTLAALSLGAGVAALSLMGTAAILGGRWRFIESWFGGLDRVYLAHKWLAVWALGFASFHLAFKAGIQGWDAAAILTLPPFHTRTVRQLSFVALMLIVMLALNRAIPYRTWRLWHKLSGPLFVIVILHWLSIKSPIAIDDPAGIWLAAIATLGVAAAAYKLLLFPLVSKHAEYQIAAVSPGAGAVHLELAPVHRTVEFTPGQFAFISIKHDGLREPHPFTIAGADDPNGHVHFVIRSLGDYTQKLVHEAKIGMRADIYAPWGRFKRSATAKREIWIGGGVGISPFIAWLKDRAAAGFEKVTLFYCYTPGRDFPPIDVLTEMARERGVELVPVASGPHSAEFTTRFNEIVRTAGADSVEISFCGPKGLLAVIRERMKELGLPGSNLRYEYFEFR